MRNKKPLGIVGSGPTTPYVLEECELRKEIDKGEKIESGGLPVNTVAKNPECITHSPYIA